MKELIAGALVRAILQIASGAGVVLADDSAYQIAAGAVALGTLAWSIWQKKKSAK
jgi:hypothetical protein